MKLYVVSKGAPERLHSMKLLDKWKITYDVVVDNKTSAKVVSDESNAKNIHVSKPAHSLCGSRNYILKLVKPNEWYMGMDDNIRVLHYVHPDFYRNERIDQSAPPPAKYGKTWRNVYRQEVTTRKQFEQYMQELHRHCIAKNTVYGGFASQENPFFRMSKWGYFRFVKSKLFVMQNVKDIKWVREAGQDSYMSALVVALCGRVVVNNYVHPAYKMYESGGIGKSEERRLILNPSLIETVKKFPGLVDIGLGANTALRFIRHSETSVERWRKEHGWLK